MEKLVLALCVFLFQVSFAQDEIEFNGIKVKTSIKVDDGYSKTKLVLNGAGFRDKMWINLYVQALYVVEKTDDGKKILEADQTLATRLYITSSLVSKKKLIVAIEDGVKKSYKGDLYLIRDRLDLLKSFFETNLDKDGYVDFVYSSINKETSVYINKTLIGKVRGKDFKIAFFGIWLSDDCVDKILKKRLLGL
jgi:hypothetical protein